jgi:hypothetical protein
MLGCRSGFDARTSKTTRRFKFGEDFFGGVLISSVEVQARSRGASDLDKYMFWLVDLGRRDVADLPLLHGRLSSRRACVNNVAQNKETTPIHKRALSASLAKNTAPLPTPSVPFFFLPFLSTSDIDQVLIASALTLEAVERTSSAGSTYVLTGRARRGGESGTMIWGVAEGTASEELASSTF